MNIILKCSLLNGIDIVNNSDCDGVEVQLLDKNNNFDILETIQKPITSIHIDLFTRQDSDTLDDENNADLKY